MKMKITTNTLKDELYVMLKDELYVMQHINSPHEYEIVVVTSVEHSTFGGITLASNNKNQLNCKWSLSMTGLEDSWKIKHLGNKMDFPEYFL